MRYVHCGVRGACSVRGVCIAVCAVRAVCAGPAGCAATALIAIGVCCHCAIVSGAIWCAAALCSLYAGVHAWQRDRGPKCGPSLAGRIGVMERVVEGTVPLAALRCNRGEAVSQSVHGGGRAQCLCQGGLKKFQVQYILGALPLR